MKTFEGVLILAYILNVFLLCPSVPVRKHKRPVLLKFDVEQAEIEREHYNAYSSNTDLYTGWPELEKNKKAREKCEIYVMKLFPKKDFKQCTVTFLITVINLFYAAKILNSSGNIIHGPVIVRSLVCHVVPPMNRRKYFHFIRAPKPECVYLINRLKQNSMDFNISLRLCEYDTFDHSIHYGMMEKANCKQKRNVRRSSRDNDTVEQREEYERNHWSWVNQAKTGTWPELVDKDRRIVCQKLLKKLYPKTAVNLEDIETSLYLEELYYTRIKNQEGSEFPLVAVVAISCNIPPRICRGSHTFIRALNYDSLNCVYRIKGTNLSDNGFRKQITKRLCVQKLYENKDRGETITITTGTNENVEPTTVQDC